MDDAHGAGRIHRADQIHDAECTRVDSIAFEGLDRTAPSYVHRVLNTRVGDPADSARTARDVERLEGMEVIERASAMHRISDPGPRCTLVFSVVERPTRLPYVQIGGVSGNPWFQLGGIDTHWLGRGYHLGTYYRYDDLHSVGVHQVLPDVLGGGWGLTYAIDRLATREPAYIGTSTVPYEVRRLSLEALVRYDLVPGRRTGRATALELGGGYLNERYTRVERRQTVGPRDVRFDKYLLKGRLRHRRLEYLGPELRGFSSVTKLQTVKTGDQPFDYWKVLEILRAYARPTNGINWAVRLRLGLATNERSPFVPFVLDNYVNVRGSGNSVARGTAELTVNLEHRQILADLPWGAVQGVGFIDASGWRPGGKGLASLLERENAVIFVGTGVRFHLFRPVPLILRFDYGINPQSPTEHGPVIGIGQYF